MQRCQGRLGKRNPTLVKLEITIDPTGFFRKVSVAGRCSTRCEVYGEYEDQARMQGEDELEFVTQAPAAEWEPCLEPARHRARDTDRIAHAHSECICLNTHTNTYLSSPRLHSLQKCTSSYNVAFVHMYVCIYIYTHM